MINEIVIMAISITKLHNIYGYMQFSFIAMSKKEAKVTKDIRKKFSLDCQPEHVLNHLCIVKKEWKIIQELQRKSGFGLDDNLKMITLTKKHMIWMV